MIRRKERDGVVVIGGYGAVGRTVCTGLAQRFPGRVFAAGRNMKKAEAFSRETGRKILPFELDLGDLSRAARALDGARLVVACAETGDTSFARACLERGIHYVDVSASYAFLREVERLDALAREHRATGVLSVGLVPGLTNLLAKRCAQVLDSVRSLDISVLLGLGGAHGEAAVRWTALVALLSRLQLGSEGFSVKVEAEGAVDGYPSTYSGSVSGRGEGYATGIVAALVAERLYAAPCERGVLHVEQLFDPSAMFDQITAHGLTVALDPPPR